MKELILQLAALNAPSGTERGIQETLLSFVKDVADEVIVDTLGNGIARKHGEGPHVMLAAHADEVGVMVIHIDEDGFLRLISVGDVHAASLVGRTIRFTNGVVGVVGVEAGVKLQDIGFDQLYADIGATNTVEALSKVKIGFEATVLEGVVELDEHRLVGRALDNRVGCAIAIEAFREAAAKGRNVSLVFTAQQTVGARGARTAAYRLQPDLALIIDAAPTGDMPKANRMEIKLGNGPAIKIMDGTAIVPLDVKNHLVQSAARVSIEPQFEVWPRGLSDAGGVQLSVDGIAVGGISYPARYVGNPSTIVDMRDVEATRKLVVEAILSR